MKIFLFLSFFPFVEQYWYILKHVTKLSFDGNFVHKGGLSITLKNHVQATGYIKQFLTPALYSYIVYKYTSIYSVLLSSNTGLFIASHLVQQHKK